jgi:hypothetical protein
MITEGATPQEIIDFPISTLEIDIRLEDLLRP